MGAHPAEENTEEGITEMIAKNPSSNTNSTASDHHTHKDDTSGGKAQASDFQATPGPAIPHTMEDMPPKASKEELKARAEELNK
ncbi:MAG: hypothetical protein M1827_001109 [Pycnora praestabilis]|nr:MAG: hypothetical protein M1827_001109 [Pycnora praestabilis]